MLLQRLRFIRQSIRYHHALAEPDNTSSAGFFVFFSYVEQTLYDSIT